MILTKNIETLRCEVKRHIEMNSLIQGLYWNSSEKKKDAVDEKRKQQAETLIRLITEAPVLVV